MIVELAKIINAHSIKTLALVVLPTKQDLQSGSQIKSVLQMIAL